MSVRKHKVVRHNKEAAIAIPQSSGTEALKTLFKICVDIASVVGYVYLRVFLRRIYNLLCI